MENKIIEFLRKKDFRFIKEIGQGCTGRTVLLKDEFIDEFFVCKKYSPYFDEHKDIFYNNFLQEIKILHKLYHINVVRVFNYYLYPKEKTGFIMMEYLIGQNIVEYIKKNPDNLNDIFKQTISGFQYLETNNILHRDIRPDNIIVTDDDLVKIIDFGFGKEYSIQDNRDKSISLNWRYDPPNDFIENFYDFRTEIYFVGKLFEEIINELGINGFNYINILKEMINKNFDLRLQSFFDIERKILSHSAVEIKFSDSEKSIYKDFANSLLDCFNKIEDGCEYISEVDSLIKDLEQAHRNSMLEDYIQNNVAVTRIFIKGDYTYFQNRNFKTDTLRDFTQFFKSVSNAKKKIILNNLWLRFDNIERYDNRYEITDEDVPF